MNLSKSTYSLTNLPSSIDNVVIAGGGIAGLFCALKLAPLPVTILVASPLGNGSSSALAQAGVASAVTATDSAKKHADDTISVSAGIANEKIVELMTSEAKERLDDLIEFGVPFDRDSDQNLNLSREAAHSERRIAGVNGDQTGKAIMKVLIEKVQNTPSIRILEGYTAEKLMLDGTKVIGIKAQNESQITTEFPAHTVVLATGGIGHLYSVSTNPVSLGGQGLAMAAMAGAVMADLEFIQFHPTAVDVDVKPIPLASEAIRGDGARLIDENGNFIMEGYHPLLDLAPRDIVARAIQIEISNGKKVFLDGREAIGNEFPKKFPGIYNKCKNAGIDPIAEPIPVAPAEHYHMGGILTDAYGRTTIDRLWAVGEVASTGAHGANRLASNSLLEAMVFSTRVANDIKSILRYTKFSYRYNETEQIDDNKYIDQDEKVIAEIQSLMSKNVGVVRNESGLLETLNQLNEISLSLKHHYSLQNMVLAARMIVLSALHRTESRGGHFRSDYPNPNPKLAQRSYFTLNEFEEFSKNLKHVK